MARKLGWSNDATQLVEDPDYTTSMGTFGSRTPFSHRYQPRIPSFHGQMPSQGSLHRQNVQEAT
jgi:hypothetical protein